MDPSQMDPSPFDQAPQVPLGSLDDDLKSMKKSGGKGPLIVVVVLVLAGIIGAAAFFMGGQTEARWDDYDAAMRLTDPGQRAAKMRDIASSDAHPDVRQQAILELRDLRDAAAVPLLIDALDEAGPIRRSAAQALNAIGSPAADRAKEKLYDVLDDTDETDRLWVAWALARLGDARSFDALLEEWKAGRVQNMPDYDPQIVSKLAGPDRLVKLVNDPDMAVRQFVAMQLGEIGGAGVVDPLIRLVNDGKAPVAQAAAAALGRTNDPRAAEPLAKAVQDRPEIRDALLDALKTAAGAPGLAQALNGTHDITLRYTVSMLIADLHDPRAGDALFAELGRTDAKEVRNRKVLLKGLRELGDTRIVPMLIEDTNSADDEIQSNAVDALGEIGGDAAAARLLEMFKTTKGRPGTVMRNMGRACKAEEAGPLVAKVLRGDDINAAAWALGRMHYLKAIPEFAKIMKRPPGIDYTTPEVENEKSFMDRMGIIRGTAQLGADAADLADDLAAVVDDTTDDQRLREEASLTLGYTIDDEGVTKALEIVKNATADPRTRALYALALGTRRTHELADQLMTVLEGPTVPENLRLPLAIAIGEAADPALDERLVALLEKQEVRTAAAFALLLGGGPSTTAKLLEAFKSDRETLDMVQANYTSHPLYLTAETFDQPWLWRRIAQAEALRRGERSWAWDYVMERLKAGWADGPGGLYPRQVRAGLAQVVRGQDADRRRLAAIALAGMGETGQLLALEAEGGEIREAVRTGRRVLIEGAQAAGEQAQEEGERRAQ
jgi:HEAT repeat protein